MKKIVSVVLALSMMLTFAACGDKTPAASTETSVSEIPFVISEDPVVVSVEPEAEAEKEEVIPPNSYRSELTNEWISEDIKNQRPIAVMIDNEKVALPHFGTSQADIVYEMMNSTANDRITRFMCIFKDWQNIEQIGNVRSTRTTNAMLFAEYNAILVHDGGPYYINQWFENPNSTNHLSGGFARIDQGKASYYEEYATNEHYTGTGEFAGNSYKSVKERIEDAGYDLEYNKYYMGEHFKFAEKEIDLKDDKNAVSAKVIKPNFDHNKSTLTYDEKTGLYVYSEYDNEYVDALTNESLTFKNLIIYATSFFEHDEHGYMTYAAIGTTQYGWYCTNGYAIPIYWEKPDQDSLTKFYNKATKEEIEINTGKTYIAICPLDDYEATFVIK